MGNVNLCLNGHHICLLNRVMFFKSKSLEYYSGYKAGDLVDVKAKLANLTLKATDLNYKYRVSIVFAHNTAS